MHLDASNAPCSIDNLSYVCICRKQFAPYKRGNALKISFHVAGLWMFPRIWLKNQSIFFLAFNLNGACLLLLDLDFIAFASFHLFHSKRDLFFFHQYASSLTWRLCFIANFSRNIDWVSIDMQNGPRDVSHFCLVSPHHHHHSHASIADAWAFAFSFQFQI